MTSTLRTKSGIKVRFNREWPSSGWAWTRLAIPLGILIAVGVTRLLVGPGHGLLPLLGVAPAVAAALGGPLYTIAIASIAIGTEALLTDGLHAEAAATTQQIRVALIVIAGVSFGGVVASYLRLRREGELSEVRGVANVTQEVLLRPIPDQVGPVRLSARYTSASSEAHVGGDLYAGVRTAKGLRLIVGDAEGKGLPAVHMAATAMYAFRVAAHEEDKLSAVATRIEAALQHELGEEQFITAVLAEVSLDWRQMAVLNCGHPPPLLLSRVGPELVGSADSGLPLGLSPLAAEEREPFTIPWETGDPVLFYTDGLVEARDATGKFFPLTESASIQDRPDPETLLEQLSAEVSRHASHQRHDDQALVLIWRQDSDAASRRCPQPAGDQRQA